MLDTFDRFKSLCIFWEFWLAKLLAEEFVKFKSLSMGKLTGAKGDMRYSSPSLFLMSLLYPWASSHIFCSDAYCVDVKRYALWSGYYFKCFIFCLQFSICQHWMHKTSLFDFCLIVFSLFIKLFHSYEFLFIIFFQCFRLVPFNIFS